MARLVLEIRSRHEQRYVPLNRGILRIGRALDNDIILTDPTISPHHFVIKRTDTDGFVLYPLSEENGMQLDGQRLTEPLMLDTQAMTLNAGRTQLRILPSDYPVAPTRQLSCSNGHYCFFGNWFFAALFFGLFIGVSALDNLLATPKELTWETFGRDQTIIMLVVMSIISGLALLVKLTSQRWELASTVTFVCMMLLLATAFDQGAVFLDYFFTTTGFGLFTDFTWSLLIAPVALLWFFIKVNHGNTASSFIIALTLLTPAAYFTSAQLITHYGWFDSFSKKAFYPEEIYPLDIRHQKTMPVDEYIKEIQQRFSAD